MILSLRGSVSDPSVIASERSERGNLRGRSISLFFLIAFYVFGSTLAAFAEETTKFQPSGPLNIRNQMPLYLFYMAPTPDRAYIPEKGSMELDVSYHVSNIIVDQHPIWPCERFGNKTALGDREWWVYTDMEVNRFNANISYAIFNNLEGSLDVPYFVVSEGYLDGIIEGFEKSFSFIKTPNARELNDKYDYAYKVYNRGNSVIYSDDKPVGFGDITTYFKYRLIQEDGLIPTTALRAAVKLPTASDELLGSGDFDYAIGLLLGKKILERLYLYFNLNYLFLGRPESLEEGKLDVFKSKMVHGMLGLEYFITDKTSMLFQATANTSVYDEGISATGDDPVVLTFGFNHNFNEKISWQFAVNENTNSAAPDFGVFTSLKVKL